MKMMMKRKRMTKDGGGMMEDRQWMDRAFSNAKGQLHESLGVPKGKTIPMDRLKAALKSKRKKLRMRAQAAFNARKANAR